MNPGNEIDISENNLHLRGRVLDILLIDRTQHKPSRPHNIIWATDSYEKMYRRGYGFKNQIKIEQITGLNGMLIQPRAAKSKEEQKYRTKEKAEVFTRLKNVKEMNMAIERSSKNWPVSKENWVEYISELRLEITCGEAPFIASRYDPANHKDVVEDISKRFGFLDYKLKTVNKFVNTKKDWMTYAELALKSAYGYEWQGDNLLIARENILLTMDDFYQDFCANKLKLKSKQRLTVEQLEQSAKIISWNIWQMDGLKYVSPLSCKPETKIIHGKVSIFEGEEPDVVKEDGCEGCIFGRPNEHNGRYAKVMDWKTGRPIKFVALLQSSRLT